MTTFRARVRKFQTAHQYHVTDGPEREYDHAGGRFRVAEVHLVLSQSAYPDDVSALDVRCYLSGPVTEITRFVANLTGPGRIDDQVLNVEQMSDKARAWLGPMLEDAEAVHAEALRAAGGTWGAR